MKQELDQDSIDAVIKYRIERSKETLSEANTLIQNGFYNAAINRLYYACYYSVNALLLKNRIQAQTHAGVKQMFGLHFIVNGKVPPNYGRFYNQLFNDRLTGDYDDFIAYDKEMLDEIYPKAVNFVQYIADNLISK